jgi:hypothetical protein
MMSRISFILCPVFIVVVLCMASTTQLSAWGDVGHRIVARIAARNLDSAAQTRLVEILRKAAVDDLHLRSIVGNDHAPPPSPSAIERAMTMMATWPDDMPGGKGRTGRWHYVDIGLFETPAQIDARCGPTCASERIKKIRSTLMSGQSIDVVQPNGQKLVFQADRQLRFLIHFMGDIHQPLHAVSNADAGGNCVRAVNYSFAQNLHSVWDTELVNAAIIGMSDPAGAIIQEFKIEQDADDDMTDPDKMAGEAFDLAKTRVYAGIKPKPAPVINTFIDISPSECSKAPAAVRNLVLQGPNTFRDAGSLRIVRHQLFRAGIRLAATLNEVFK